MPGDANYIFEAKKITVYNLILLYKLTVAQLVKKSPDVYGTRVFSTVFSRARHWIPHSALSQFNPVHALTH
jgi:hypothetical protein